MTTGTDIRVRCIRSGSERVRKMSDAFARPVENKLINEIRSTAESVDMVCLELETECDCDCVWLRDSA